MRPGREPSLGSEPTAAAFGPLRVLHRGFIANRDAIGCADPSDGAAFAAAYERWGADLGRHVFGEYAVALYDTRARSLLPAHDELGLMPLYYSTAGAGIVFGSHLDDVVRATGAGELDEEYIADHFARGDHFGERTPHRHVRRLLPGRNLTWTGGELRLTDTWSLGNLPPLEYRDEREYDEHFRSLLALPADACTPATGKVWCELSGGLDSSTVLAFASRRNAAVEATSFVFPKSYMSDEREWIEPVLREYPVPWHPIDHDAVRPFSELPARPHAEPNEWIARAGLERVYTGLLDQHGVEVVLSGEGGDAVLLGDEQFPFFFADLLLHGRLGRLWRGVGDWTVGKRSRTFGLFAYAVRPALRYLRSVPLEYRPSPIPWASEAFARRAQLERRGRAVWLPPAASVGAAYVLQRMLLAMHIIAVQHARSPHRDRVPAPAARPRAGGIHAPRSARGPFQAAPGPRAPAARPGRPGSGADAAAARQGRQLPAAHRRPRKQPGVVSRPHREPAHRAARVRAARRMARDGSARALLGAHAGSQILPSIGHAGSLAPAVGRPERDFSSRGTRGAWAGPHRYFGVGMDLP